MTLRKYTLASRDGFTDYYFSDQEISDRTLQAHMAKPRLSLRQARLRALCAAREAVELNIRFMLSPDEPAPADLMISQLNVYADRDRWDALAGSIDHLRRCFDLKL